jgi:putative transposase
MWTPLGRVDLYLLVFLHLGTRRCWISPCTKHPDAAWVTQQARNFLMDADDWGLSPQIVMRDNDGKFQGGFDAVIESSGAKIHRTVPMAPNLRAHVERFIQSFQVECLDKFVIVAERHLNHIGREYQACFNTDRPHSSRDHWPPTWESAPPRVETLRLKDVVCTTRLGGMLRSYSRRAA